MVMREAIGEHSKRWAVIVFFSLIVGEGIVYGFEAAESIVLALAGMLLNLLLYSALHRLEGKVYNRAYLRLGFDILYEFLSGKRGAVRQFWDIWVVFALPFALSKRYVSPTHFWAFTLPTTLTGALLTRHMLNWKGEM
ncbi:hypothetical protein [Thermococcus sp. Bubb.Bath]|uniref:hypothetical protein n=1 Tax=Thermococcus sp. Bubb.Bath TaxID=1638242 RepID=UPI00143BB2F5|nr:hypothetical protein [Thermococcus sp. Bubb.Bath]NJF25589.1 hypothetical protein [Thermococcus sp. Bubb.Bath]